MGFEDFLREIPALPREKNALTADCHFSRPHKYVLERRELLSLVVGRGKKKKEQEKSLKLPMVDFVGILSLKTSNSITLPLIVIFPLKAINIAIIPLMTSKIDILPLKNKNILI